MKYNEYDLSTTDFIEKILEKERGEYITEEEVWEIAKEYDEMPSFENIVISLRFQKFREYIQENLENNLKDFLTNYLPSLNTSNYEEEIFENADFSFIDETDFSNDFILKKLIEEINNGNIAINLEDELSFVEMEEWVNCVDSHFYIRLDGGYWQEINGKKDLNNIYKQCNLLALREIVDKHQYDIIDKLQQEKINKIIEKPKLR